MRPAAALSLVLAISSCVSTQTQMSYWEESPAARTMPVTLSLRQFGSQLHYAVTVTNTLPAEICFPAWYLSAAPIDVLHLEAGQQLVGDPIDEFFPADPVDLIHLRPGEVASLRGELDLSGYRSFTQSGKAQGLAPRPGDAVALRFRGIFDTCRSGVHSRRALDKMVQMQEYRAPGTGEVLVVTSDASRPVRLP